MSDQKGKQTDDKIKEFFEKNDQELMWTKKQPTKEGYYFLRGYLVEPWKIEHIKIEGGTIWCVYPWVCKKDWNGEFAGPIESPQEATP